MMKYNSNIHHRRSIRLKGYDYSQAGLYFITICVQNRQCLFGEIVGAKNFSPETGFYTNRHSSQMDINRKIVSLRTDINVNHHSFPQMILNDAGKTANECWLEIPKHFPNVVLHEHIVMPNHVHGIVELVGANQQLSQMDVDIDMGMNEHLPETGVGINTGANKYFPKTDFDINTGTKNFSPLRSPSKTIGSVVRGYKIGVTKWFRANTDIEKLWQRNYYEHIIRDEQSYQRISEYIINNPKNWDNDKLYKQQ